MVSSIILAWNVSQVWTPWGRRLWLHRKKQQWVELSAWHHVRERYKGATELRHLQKHSSSGTCNTVVTVQKRDSLQNPVHQLWVLTPVFFFSSLSGPPYKMVSLFFGIFLKPFCIFLCLVVCLFVFNNIMGTMSGRSSWSLQQPHNFLILFRTNFVQRNTFLYFSAFVNGVVCHLQLCAHSL